MLRRPHRARDSVHEGPPQHHHVVHKENPVLIHPSIHDAEAISIILDCWDCYSYVHQKRGTVSGHSLAQPSSRLFPIVEPYHTREVVHTRV